MTIRKQKGPCKGVNFFLFLVYTTEQGNNWLLTVKVDVGTRDSSSRRLEVPLRSALLHWCCLRWLKDSLLLSLPLLYQPRPEAEGTKMDHPWSRRATEVKHFPSQPSPKICVCTHELSSGLNSSCWIVGPSWHTFGFSTKHCMTLAWVSHLNAPWIIPADSLLKATLFWRQENLITQMKTALCHWPQDPRNVPKHI